MRLARATAGHVPAHARPAQPAIERRATSRRADERSRLQRWTPVLVIAVIYLVAIGINEWRLHQHVQELRDQPAAEVVVEPASAQSSVFFEAGG